MLTAINAKQKKKKQITKPGHKGAFEFAMYTYLGFHFKNFTSHKLTKLNKNFVYAFRPLPLYFSLIFLSFFLFLSPFFQPFFIDFKGVLI